MAIDFVEIRNKNRTLVGIIDTAKSIIWHSVYFGVGDFEIYAVASTKHLNFLREGYFVTRHDSDDIGIIEDVHITTDPQEGAMIAATGRFAKSVLDRRVIYNIVNLYKSGFIYKSYYAPSVLRAKVEVAVRKLITDNVINCSFDSMRNMPQVGLGQLMNYSDTIVDEEGNPAEKQVTADNLMEYTDGVLEEYGMAAKMVLGNDQRLLYQVYKGADRSADNNAGNIPIIFSQEFDNLVSSDYEYSTQGLKNTALIGGEGEGIDRFYAVLASDQVGINRREMWVDASSNAQTVSASELQNMFPTGVFDGLKFKVGGITYANLVTDTEREYTQNALDDLFGGQAVVSGGGYYVNGVLYATQVYGTTNKYKLTDVGYKGVLDAEEEEGDYRMTKDVYEKQLKQVGKQELAQNVALETFNGELMVSNANYVFGRDFFLGDIVTIQDNSLDKYINARIVETTEVQDDNGYAVDIVYK